jgi:hypothetical protein
VPVQQKPEGQEEKPSDTNQSDAGAGAESPVAPAQTDDDDRGAGIVAQDDSGAAVQKAGFADSTAVDVWPGLSRLIGSHAPNYKADIAVFASILSLALAGIWIEWRVLGRQPA